MEKDLQDVTQDAILRVNNIDVFYSGFQALWDTTFSVKHGEIVALLGANAAGKTTLLDTISGFLHPTKGNIEFDGKTISGLKPSQVVDLGISQIPEGRAIFPDMTVFENLILGSYNRRARPKREQNLKRVYELFPILKQRKDQIAKTLSGGEQQMLVIGRGLMSDPKLILIDEMSLGLAPIVVNALYKVLKEIRERGITILFVEQNVRRSLEEAERAYIMEAGRIVLSGSVAELREEEQIKKAYFGI